MRNLNPTNLSKRHNLIPKENQYHFTRHKNNFIFFTHKSIISSQIRGIVIKTPLNSVLLTVLDHWRTSLVLIKNKIRFPHFITVFSSREQHREQEHKLINRIIVYLKVIVNK